MSSNPQQHRADVRRILSFIRTMNRLNEAWGDREPKFDVKIRVSPTGPEIVEAPPWTDVENLLGRFRPIYLDSEDSSFRSIVRILPRHLNVKPTDPTVEFKSFADLEKRWDALLDGTTAPLPAGATMVGYPIPPGWQAESQAESILEVGFDGKKLTGRDAIELLLYGTLVHVDQSKERKRLRMEKTFVEPAYRCAVMSLLAELIKTADQLRIYADGFVEELVKLRGTQKIEEIESESDPPDPNPEAREARLFSFKAGGQTIVEKVSLPEEDVPEESPSG